MKGRFLELELRLLVLRYGRPDVLAALDRIGEQTPEDVERALRTAEESRSPRRPKPSILESVATECRDRPEIAEPLRALAVAFQNRRFLPHLRDVQQFLDRAGVDKGKQKSRDAAIPHLVRVLGALTHQELLKLTANNDPRGESDYAALARAIMKTPPPGSRDTARPTDSQPPVAAD